MDQRDLLNELDAMKNTMIAVATSDLRVENCDAQFVNSYVTVSAELRRLGIENSIPHSSLWHWQVRFASGDLPTYSSRRAYVSQIFDSLRSAVEQGYVEKAPIPYQPTGWARVDRVVGQLRDRLASATVEEDFQAVGLLCREALISAGQAVFDSQRHAHIDSVTPSETDAAQLLESFIASEMSGGLNDAARKHIRSALDLAVTLQH